MKRYCIRCAERLNDPAAPRCARCNQPFDRDDPATFHATSAWRRPRSWLPGLLLGVLVGYAGFELASRFDERGWGLFLALPVAVGLTMGLTMPVSVGMGMLLVPGALVLLAGVVMWLEMAGVFCMLTLYAMFLPGAIAGMLIGCYLRFDRLRARVARGVAVITIVAIALGTAEVQGRLGPIAEIVVVRTERVVDAPPSVVWRHLHFYEEIESEPPFLLRFGLPIPVRAVGSKAEVGATEECIYEGGKGITKRITQRENERLLAFEVIEQRLGFEHDLTLLGGAFELERVAGGRTRLTLSTRYRARSYPAWVWRPLEAHVLHTLHDHVAGEIERRARRERQQRPVASATMQR